MSRITLNEGESLVKLLKKAGGNTRIDSGIWLIERGSLQKRASNSLENMLDDYSVINLYSSGDYFIGDSDLKIDYFALEETIISTISINEIDPIKLLFQLNSLEELVFINSYHLEKTSTEVGRVALFFDWVCRKLNRSITNIPLTQSEIGKLLGITRLTVYRKLKLLKIGFM